MRTSWQVLDRMEVVFDDDNAVGNGGMVLPISVAGRLGVRELVDELVDLGDAPGRANVGLKTIGLIASALAGGDSIDDAEVLRSGRSQMAIGQWMPAPSTLGTFLRSFTWAHARQLDTVAARLLGRAWAAGAGPGDSPLTIDVDSTITEVYGSKKQGACYGYTKVRGYHPLVAATAGRGDVLGVRLRGGNAHTARGSASFLTEVFNRARAAGASGPFTLRADSGFYSKNVVDTCKKADSAYSITVKMSKALHKAISAIDEKTWTPIPYWIDDGADVAETTWKPFGRGQAVRLIVRRTKPTPGSQLALLATYDYHAFITDREGDTVALEADHRAHAGIELVIRDLKEGAGWAHLPSGRFGANAAWLAIGAIAHNLARWTPRLGGMTDTAITTPTLRRRFIAIPGHVSRSARRTTMHLARDWPWRQVFLDAMATVRNLEVCLT